MLFSKTYSVSVGVAKKPITRVWLSLLPILFLSFAISCDKSVGPDNSIEYGSMTDIDGYSYNTVKIGNQTWMASNLRTTRYNDGSEIPHIADGDSWTNARLGAYCYYNNTSNIDSMTRYGALYNWYAVASNKLSPSGWHVPNDSDWNVLISYLMQTGYSYNGRLNSDTIAKSLAAKTDWATTTSHIGVIGNDLQANNKSGFSAYPGGGRYDASFDFMSHNAYWWTPLEQDSMNAYSMKLDWINESPYMEYYPKSNGFAVRLVKDQ